MLGKIHSRENLLGMRTEDEDEFPKTHNEN